MEYRFQLNARMEVVLRFDGRVIEVFRPFEGDSRRFLHPETSIERGEPNRNGRVTFTFRANGIDVDAFAIDEPWVAGFDAFIVGLDGPGTP